MGTDLVPIGNHKINFSQKGFKELAHELCQKLNAIKFVNAEYLRLFALHCVKSEFPNVRLIREIKTKKEWTYMEGDPAYERYTVDGNIEFDGPFNLSLYFTEHYIYFFNPSSRYRHWIEDDTIDGIAFRNEWRKYMHQVVHACGGDRVIYLADNAHPLESFSDMEVSFEEVEKALHEKFGAPKKTFRELAENSYNSYMIDYLKDIMWHFEMPLWRYYPEPDDLTRVNIDFKDFATKEQLNDIDWNEYTLKHKLTDGIIHYFHIARFEGVIVKHYGQINGNEKIETFLDEYAPFTYDELQKVIERAGYNRELGKCYSINFFESSHRWSWDNAIKKFKQKLVWTGNGVPGGGTFGAEESGQLFYAVDEKLALELLLSLRIEYQIKAPIEVVRQEEDDTTTVILKQ